ncbi:MAG TPA: class I SAM-dependent methyltransferase [Acidobacteriaceae bacterium]|nr:class I SAM-dependent methyltransferase [Acidobacteriaceae bacterium]
MDRWLWLKKYLPVVEPGSRSLVDVGCGTGAFTMGAARRGYRSLGLSWDKRNQSVAQQRAKICKADTATFEVQDVRRLDERPDLAEQFDVAICCECIEHILDDVKLMQDIAQCLKPAGTLLLTTPNLSFKPMAYDNENFSTVENGAHVRRGYSPDDLTRLCQQSGFEVMKIEYCSGILSQKITSLKRIAANATSEIISWPIVLPLRWIPPMFDSAVTRAMNWPDYSITLVARKK